MPSSDAAPPDSRWRAALALAAGTLVLGLALVVGRVVWFDAYWLFRETPPWLEATGGGNRLLDRQTRRAKVLQALVRDYEIALVGSSTVYSGLDPRDVSPELRGRVFNVGISAVLADELPVVASVVASRSAVERVVLGLDYYMFSRRGSPSMQLARSLQTPVGRWNTFLGSLISEYALRDSFLEQVAGSDDPGPWTRDGFRVVPPLPAELTLRNDATRRRTTAAYDPGHARIARAGALEVRRPVGHDLPRAGQRGPAAHHGRVRSARRFRRWRADVARIAAARGLRFQDLADLGCPTHSTPATARRRCGSTISTTRPCSGARSWSGSACASPGRRDDGRGGVCACPYPVPPAKASALRRLAEMQAGMPAGADLVLLGDSLAAGFPGALVPLPSAEWRLVNLGLPGDRVQNTLWRLENVPTQHLRPRVAILLLGTNNLGDGDPPDAIAAGILAVLRRALAPLGRTEGHPRHGAAPGRAAGLSRGGPLGAQRGARQQARRAKRA
jgi:hypothetical protein